MYIHSTLKIIVHNLANMPREESDKLNVAIMLFIDAVVHGLILGQLVYFSGIFYFVCVVVMVFLITAIEVTKYQYTIYGIE